MEGKINAARYARENKIPYLGICLGMQVALIEYARNMAGLKNANSTEFDLGTDQPVVALISEWQNHDGQVQQRDENSDLGGTMRLGSYKCTIEEGTLAHKAYNATQVNERHRHRYEFNNEYKKQFVEAGLTLSGINPDGGLVEIIEIAKHPFFMGVQFHPEYKSTVENPHPLFVSFVKATLG